MWLIFGLSAMISAVLNVVFSIWHRKTKWFRFVSMSCTAFALCAFLSQINAWVLAGDWSALVDVLPGTFKAMWVLTVASVVINSISLLKKK